MSQNTEELIKSAAREMFLKKGYLGTTTRDIAEYSGINRALVNYYFRSKENLFATVFKELAELYFQDFTATFELEIPFLQKIDLIIQHDLERHLECPEMSKFMTQELPALLESDDQISATIKSMSRSYVECIRENIDKAVAAGEINPIDPFQLFMLMNSVKHVFASKTVLSSIHGMEEEDFLEVVTSYKKNIMQMLTKLLSKQNS